MTSNLSRQFDAPHGDAGDKLDLIDQLSYSFHHSDLAWLTDPHVKVTRTSVHPSQIDTDHRAEWEATHEPGKVKKHRKEIKHGDDRPVVLVNRPHKGTDSLFVMDGHHHEEAYTQLLDDRHAQKNKHIRALNGEMPAYVISVPKTSGPWDELHSKQIRGKG